MADIACSAPTTTDAACGTSRPTSPVLLRLRLEVNNPDAAISTAAPVPELPLLPGTRALSSGSASEMCSMQQVDVPKGLPGAEAYAAYTDGPNGRSSGGYVERSEGAGTTQPAGPITAPVLGNRLTSQLRGSANENASEPSPQQQQPHAPSPPASPALPPVPPLEHEPQSPPRHSHYNAWDRYSTGSVDTPVDGHHQPAPCSPLPVVHRVPSGQSLKTGSELDAASSESFNPMAAMHAARVSYKGRRSTSSGLWQAPVGAAPAVSFPQEASPARKLDMRTGACGAGAMSLRSVPGVRYSAGSGAPAYADRTAASYDGVACRASEQGAYTYAGGAGDACMPLAHHVALEAKHQQLWRQYERSIALQAQLEARCSRLEQQLAGTGERCSSLQAYCLNLQQANTSMAMELRMLRSGTKQPGAALAAAAAAASPQQHAGAMDAAQEPAAAADQRAHAAFVAAAMGGRQMRLTMSSTLSSPRRSSEGGALAGRFSVASNSSQRPQHGHHCAPGKGISFHHNPLAADGQQAGEWAGGDADEEDELMQEEVTQGWPCMRAPLVPAPLQAVGTPSREMPGLAEGRGMAVHHNPTVDCRQMLPHELAAAHVNPLAEDSDDEA